MLNLDNYTVKFEKAVLGEFLVVGGGYRVVAQHKDRRRVPKRIGFIYRLEEPRKVAGYTVRWRAHIDGKWIDIPRRKDFEQVYRMLARSTS